MPKLTTITANNPKKFDLYECGIFKYDIGLQKSKYLYARCFWKDFRAVLKYK